MLSLYRMLRQCVPWKMLSIFCLLNNSSCLQKFLPKVHQNAKFQLWNALTDWLDTYKLGWSAIIVESHAFLCSVMSYGTLIGTTILWQADRAVFVIFSGFAGYNWPEKRKAGREVLIQCLKRFWIFNRRHYWRPSNNLGYWPINGQEWRTRSSSLQIH